MLLCASGSYHASRRTFEAFSERVPPHLRTQVRPISAEWEGVRPGRIPSRRFRVLLDHLHVREKIHGCFAIRLGCVWTEHKEGGLVRESTHGPDRSFTSRTQGIATNQHGTTTRNKQKLKISTARQDQTCSRFTCQTPVSIVISPTRKITVMILEIRVSPVIPKL